MNRSKPDDTLSIAKCINCGAATTFSPGSNHTACQYCKSVQPLSTPEGSEVLTHDYYNIIDNLNVEDACLSDTISVKCNSCGATSVFSSATLSDVCSFCTSALIVNLGGQERILRPHYILPFNLNNDEADHCFKEWIKSRWFAPSDLFRKASGKDATPLKGIYIPYWSFDTITQTNYTGQRGTYYYTNETYTENGKTKTRSVRNTSWRYVSGMVECVFRDILISAANSVPQDIVNKLEPWDLNKLVSYDARYFAGFISEAYQIGPEESLEIAKHKIEPAIQTAIENDIGGDEQRVSDSENSYFNIGVKYISLPVWFCSYKYRSQTYHIVVNASTGEVWGTRPYSLLKISILILAILAIIAWMYHEYQMA